MSVKQIEYKGKTIIYLDYRGLTQMEEQIKNIEELTQIVNKTTTPILSVANFEGAVIGNNFMTEVKNWGKEHESSIKRQAVLGVTGLKSILFQAYLTFTGVKNTKAFDNEAEAMDWLVGA